MKMKPRLYLSPPHMSGHELEKVNKAFASNWIAPVGPHVTAFEMAMCAYINVPSAAALSSGTAAIHLALQLCEVKAGDDVYCSSFTFAGSAFPITYQQATPVFIDSEACSWNLDPELLRKAIKERMAAGKRPGAVIVVHLYGQSADVSSIKAICVEFGIPLIEDAAESLGARCGKVNTGTLGDFGILSFNGNKIITTSGGGMLVGHDKAKIEKARSLSTQARDSFPWYEHSTIGYNYRMSNILAAIGCGQLMVIDERVAKKRIIYDRYNEALANIDGIALIPRDIYGRSNCWLTCITINPGRCKKAPEDIRMAFEQENIECRPLWKPMHLQPVFSSSPAYINGVAERLFATGICLPSGTGMGEEELERVVSILIKLLQGP